MDKAFTMFQARLKDNQLRLVTICEQIELIFNGDDLNAKLSIVNDMNSVCAKLIELGDSETPSWVIQLNQFGTTVVQNLPDLAARRRLVGLIGQLKNEIALHDWAVGGYQNNVNFEEIYKKYKNESKLPELFDELIKLIEAMLSDPDIDLADSERKFRFLLTIVRSNTNRSFFGDQSVVNYLLIFIREFLLNLSAQIPGLKEFIEALMSTAQKIKNEFEETRNRTQTEVKQLVKFDDILLYDSEGTMKEIESQFEKKVDFLV